jgi:hypothetical protein
MGHETYFYGTLQFTRKLDGAEMVCAEKAIEEREFAVNRQKNGIVYASEKSWDLVSQVNTIIADIRQDIPDFGLKGSLYAETDYEPYSWLLKIDARGCAIQVACQLEDLPLADQKIFRKERDRMWLDWSQRCALYRLQDRHKVLNAGYDRHQYAKYGRPDARIGFRKAADAICFGVIEMVSRIQGRISHERSRLTHG